MTSSNDSSFIVQIREPLLDLLWSLWGELGVSSWIQRHQRYWIDPEPLIVLTSQFGEWDPRLRDESIDWIIQFGSYISSIRLRHFLRAWPAVSEDQWAQYAATVNAHSEHNFPNASTARRYRPSGKSQLSAAVRPALLTLRLRGLFGVSGRAEILRAFINEPDRYWPAAGLALETGYKRRNLEIELAVMRQIGAVDYHDRMYRFRRHETLSALVAPLPAAAPKWDAIFEILLGVIRTLERHDREDVVIRTVEYRRSLSQLEKAVQRARVPPPPTSVFGTEFAPAFETWALDLVSGIARAEEFALGTLRELPPVPSDPSPVAGTSGSRLA